MTLLYRLWHVHPPVALTVQAAPDECFQALAAAARPSTQRLHLRNLFADGRRYYLDRRAGGFRLTSNSRVLWHRRSRTTIAAVLLGEFSPAGKGATRIHLRARMRLFFLLDTLIVPLFMASILIFAPWHPLLIGGLIAALLLLSWLWHRLTATLQAADMVFFVQKALEDLTPVDVPLLGEAAPDTITHDFGEQWEKFYRQQLDQDDENLSF